MTDNLDAEPLPPRPRLRWLRPLLLTALLLAAAFIWLFTPLGEIADMPATLDAAHRWAEYWWAPFAIALAFTGLSLVAFPLTAMLALTGMLYGPVEGFAIGMASGLFAATIGFGIGHFLGHDWLEHRGGWVNRMSQAMGRHGIVTVAILRMTPVASFALINYVSGAAHIRYGSFLAGTIIGGTPYALVLTFFGDRVEQLLREPTWERVVFAVLAFLAVMAVALLAHRLALLYRRWAAGRRRGLADPA